MIDRIFAKKTRSRWLGALGGVFFATLMQCPSATANGSGAPLYPWDFIKSGERGFGDSHNNFAWSMAWFKGKLYVGSNRDAACTQAAIGKAYVDTAPYPPNDPEVDCTPLIEDLPLRAEIWCWDPATDLWQRVYQAPEDLPIPGAPGKFVSRDIGYRDMIVFTERDGTEALYVAGFCSRDFHRGLPPPRLLRSVDGITFEPVPQDPGTVLGDLDMWVAENITISGFNRMFIHQGKLLVALGGGYGHSVLLESEDPQLGNDTFRRTTPEGMTVTAVESYEGYLYVGVGAQPVPQNPPFEIVKTDTSGPYPYQWQTVLPEGAYRGSSASTTIVKMYVHDGHLWAGSNRPTEFFRINPDDSWEIMVGTSRNTPDGQKPPWSGLADGFNWFANIHVHSMISVDGWLYLGINDFGFQYPLRSFPFWQTLAAPQIGFDFYRTRDGYYLYEISRDGLEGFSNDFTVRNMENTPEGLFIGTGNNHEGFQIWQGKPSAPPMVQAPDILEIEPYGFGGCMLHWEGSPDAVEYRVLVANGNTGFEFHEVARTPDWVAILRRAPGGTSTFKVVAVDAQGNFSPASNIAPWRTRAPIMKYSSLLGAMETWGVIPIVTETVLLARSLQLQGNTAAAITVLQDLKVYVDANPSSMQAWHLHDFEVLVNKLIRRSVLVQRSLIWPYALL